MKKKFKHPKIMRDYWAERQRVYAAKKKRKDIQECQRLVDEITRKNKPKEAGYR